MNTLRGLVLGIGIFSLAGCTTNRFNLDELNDDRNIRYSRSLEVNTENIDRVMTRKDEERGVIDLMELADNSVLEDSWVYLPQHNLWIEIGKEENLKVLENREKNMPSPYLNGHYQDLEYLDRIVKKNNEAHIYHIHPGGKEFVYTVMQKEEKRGIKFLPNKENYQSRFLELCKNYNFSPSIQDFYSMVSTSLHSFEVNDKCKVIFRVVSMNGIVEYKLTDEGKALFKRVDYAERDEKLSRLHQSLVSFNEKSLDSKIAPNKNKISDLSNRYIDIRFIPKQAFISRH